MACDGASHRLRAPCLVTVPAMTVHGFTFPNDVEGRVLTLFQARLPALRPRPYQRPHPPIWRSVVTPGSFAECGRLGLPILTARVPLDRIPELADTGADYVSVGALTHSAPAADLSFELEPDSTSPRHESADV